MVNKFCPCKVRSVIYCFGSFMLLFTSVAGILPNVEEKKNALLLALCLFIIHILVVLYSIFKLNSYVYFDDEKIYQKQYGKIVEIKYNEIEKFKFSNGGRIYNLLKIYKKNKKIIFELSDKNLNLFYSKCNNKELNNKIKKVTFQIERGTYKF